MVINVYCDFDDIFTVAIFPQKVNKHLTATFRNIKEISKKLKKYQNQHPFVNIAKKSFEQKADSGYLAN
jgi:hypothetical protein